MFRLLAILAILAFMAALAPHAASAAPLDQHRGNSVHAGVGGNWHHGHNGFVGRGWHGFGPGWGFRPPVVVAPFLPVVAPVAVPVSYPVAVPVPAYTPPAVNYAPALAAPSCGCPQ